MGARQLRPGQLRTGSLFDITSSFAISASYAKNAATASYALNAVPFPFSGSAIVTGSLEIKSDRNNIFIIKKGGLPLQVIKAIEYRSLLHLMVVLV